MLGVVAPIDGALHLQNEIGAVGGQADQLPVEGGQWVFTMRLNVGGQVGLCGGEFFFAQFRQRFFVHHGGRERLEVGDVGLYPGELRIERRKVIMVEKLRVVEAGRARAAGTVRPVTGGAVVGEEFRAFFDGARQVLLLKRGHAPGFVNGDPADKDH